MVVKASNLIDLTQCCGKSMAHMQSRYLTLMQQLAIFIIFEYKEIFIELKPINSIKECHIYLPGINFITLKKEELQKALFETEERYCEPIERYGEILILKILQHSVFTGAVYRNMPPDLSTREEVLQFLIESAKQILYKDEEFLNTLLRCRKIYRQ